jgi:hypothetical protein
MSSNETIKQSVIAGMGISFLSLHTIALEVSSGLISLLNIEATPVMRTWNVVTLQSKQLSPVADAFRRYIIEHGEPHLLAQDMPLLARLGLQHLAGADSRARGSMLAHPPMAGELNV